MTINDRRVGNHIHDVVLMVENLTKVCVSSMSKVVFFRNVSFSTKGEFVSVLGPLDGSLIGEKR
jgi:hypothetical protein